MVAWRLLRKSTECWPTGSSRFAARAGSSIEWPRVGVRAIDLPAPLRAPVPDQNLPPSLPAKAQMSRSLRAAIPGELDTRASSDSKKSKCPTTGALSVESLRRPRDGIYVGLQLLLSCC